MKKMSPRAKNIMWVIISSLLYTFSVTGIVLCIWSRVAFDVGFRSLLYTLTTPMQGTGSGVISMALWYCVPKVAFFVLLYVVAVIVLLVGKKRVFKLLRKVGVIFCAFLLIFCLVFAFFILGVPEYLKYMLTETTIYEEYYVDPETVAITSNGKTKNLICIYVESMETTYASTEVGGYQSINYMPHMTALAQENVSFSDKTDGKLGGFHSPTGTTWTMGALLSMTSGVPYSFPVVGDYQLVAENFASGLTTMGDILEEKGYRQMFLCGSDAEFAGRKPYFEQHGNYEVEDLYTAYANGEVANGYHNGFWGYEDEILYRIAKEKLAELAAGDQPFNLSMLTVDTHHYDGYICNLCQTQYGTQLENVVSCADKQLYEFVEWCKAQPFYEDTVIVIVGDHPRMDTSLVENVEFYDRTMYNCFINAAVECESSTEGRVWTSLDVFPTTLGAMGFEIEGDRLGLGVNLFSDTPTLAEQLGYWYLNEEISCHSDYYNEHFT